MKKVYSEKEASVDFSAARNEEHLQSSLSTVSLSLFLFCLSLFPSLLLSFSPSFLHERACRFPHKLWSNLLGTFSWYLYGAQVSIDVLGAIVCYISLPYHGAIYIYIYIYIYIFLCTIPDHAGTTPL